MPAPSDISLGPPLQFVDRLFVRLRRRKLLYFGGCDYFRLSWSPAVRKAVGRGMERYGLNVAASRVTTGNHELYDEAECRLADFFKVESATLTSNGYLPALIVGQALRGHVTHAFVDDQAHGCLADAVRFLDCPVRKFRRGDVDQLRKLLRSHSRRSRPVVFSEGVYATDGEIAPLDRYLAALPVGGLLVVDDAHGVGVLGEHGRGTVEALEIHDERVLRLVTFSKAFGVYGGAALGPEWLREQIIAGSRAFAGNTPLPLPLVSGLLAALTRMEQGRAMRWRLRLNTGFVKSALRVAGASVPENLVPIIVLSAEDEAAERTIRRLLLAHGIYPSFIHYPGMPARGCFRFVISSEHKQEHLEALVGVLVPSVRNGRLRACSQAAQ